MQATQTVSQHSPLVQFPSAVESITQLELELFLSLRKRLHQLQGQVATEEAKLKARLEAGASVDPGVHVASLKENFRRNVSWKAVVIRLATRLKLDGAAYCARVLSATKPDRTVSLEVS
jgi:hypothetical protein